jgi:hypothetical protein
VIQSVHGEPTVFLAIVLNDTYFGKNCQMSPLIFSLVSRSQEA